MLSMNFRKLILIPFLMIGFSDALHTEATTNLSALKYYNQALSLSREGKIRPAIKALEAAVAEDDKFADAYHQLGLLYPNLGTVHSRIKATWAMEKALGLDSKNVRYLLDMAKLLLKKGMKGAAINRFNKVVTLDPGNAEAYYQLGLLKAEDMLWHKDLIIPHEYFYFTFDKYTDEDLWEATEYFEKAIEANPKFADAYYRLALVQYESQEYESMANNLRKAIIAQPDNKDFYLFMGLAFHRMGRHDAAYELYTKAKSLMSEEELAFLDSVEPLLNSESEERYASLSTEDKGQFESAFWKQKDPLYLTEINERTLEHYSRVAYANMRFGSREKGIEGWTTDQGEAYIRFGPPEVKYRTRPGLRSSFGAGSPLIPSQEYWGYPEFKLFFEDLSMSRNYTLKRDFFPEDDYKLLYERLIKETPDYYEPDFDGSKFEVPSSIAQFRGEPEKTKVELFYGIPSDQINLIVKDDTTKTKAALKKGIFVFDENWEDVFRKVRKQRFALAGLIDENEPLFMIDRQQLNLTPGTYHIAVELVDESSKSVGTRRDELSVRAIDEEHLQMSDLLLATDIKDKPYLPVYSFGNLNIVPSLFHTFTGRQPVFVYFEIYNLSLDETNSSRYTIETILRPEKEQKNRLASLASNVGRIFGFGRSQKSEEISISYEYTGNSKTESHNSSLQLAEAKPGTYSVTVRITDLSSGETVEGDVAFEIR